MGSGLIAFIVIISIIILLIIGLCLYFYFTGISFKSTGNNAWNKTKSAGNQAKNTYNTFNTLNNLGIL